MESKGDRQRPITTSFQKFMFKIYDTEKKNCLALIWCGNGEHKTEKDIAYVGDILPLVGGDEVLTPLTFDRLSDAIRVATKLTSAIGRQFRVKQADPILQIQSSYGDIALFRIWQSDYFFHVKLALFRLSASLTIPKADFAKLQLAALESD